jgi:hypothetical protein
MALGEEFNCISLVSVNGRTTDIHPGDSFVDDTTTGATDDNHNLDPIPSHPGFADSHRKKIA